MGLMNYLTCARLLIVGAGLAAFGGVLWLMLGWQYGVVLVSLGGSAAVTSALLS